jgi:hypothetical protein
MGIASYSGASSAIKPGVVTTATRPSSPFVGQLIYDTTLSQTLAWNGSAWVVQTGGLVYITQATPSAVNSVSINDCFSSTYQNYKIVFNATTSVGVNSYLSMRYRLSGSDTITQYSYTELNTDGTSVSTSASALGNTLQPIGYIDPTYKGMQYWIDLQDINQAVKTKCYILTSNASAAGAYTIRNLGGVQDATTQFTGITFTTSGTSFTGTIRVYGYANS